jgi:hypothetical protein
MAEKKKSTSEARPRGKKAPAAVEASAPALAVAAPVAPAEVAAPVAAAAPAKAAPTAPVEAAPAAPVEAAPAPVTAAPSHADIARRAQDIYRARGGTAFDNWLQAERELRA